eukprot:GHVL01038380.1.p1 GENE.GHVL01038380.1~~GHVL01038380.1.p1  ORF type:complete len:154 (+),score=23.64 GHVL01038380.1:608-1069(+)
MEHPNDSSNMQLTWMSRDQKASLEWEKTRIKQLNGELINGRICGILEPSRTIGDFDIKYKQPPGVVSAVPELRYFLPSGSGLLILASDGVWDAIGSKEVTRCINNSSLMSDIRMGTPTDEDLESLCKTLISLSRKGGSVDDCTCQVIYFNPSK